MNVREVVDRLNELLPETLQVGRIPGAAVAIVADRQVAWSQGYGYRDLERRLPVTADTIYPIASTTKAFCATLIGMLVEDGKLSWDRPIRGYLPGFHLLDPIATAYTTLRDLLSMRTGLPRHDWMWLANAMSREQMAERLRWLEPSAGFREKFQYNNLTVTLAGYIAEVVTGQDWNTLIQERILDPLQMSQTSFALPQTCEATLSYHENIQRTQILTRRLTTEVTAPSGGVIHSTVNDMARWVIFNLHAGRVGEQQLIEARTLGEIQSPQVVARTDPGCPSPNATYAMGWFSDVYNGQKRLTHGGYLHDVNSEVTLYPGTGIGVVSFTNSGGAGLARIINQYVMDLASGSMPEQTFASRLAVYENSIAETRARVGNCVARRVEGTAPSHALSSYVGNYSHPGYGELTIRELDNGLEFTRGGLTLDLEHWHYETWLATRNDLVRPQAPHPFDRASLMLFETDVNGGIAALSIALEPAVAPIRFTRC